MDRLAARVVGVGGVQVLARPQAVDVRAVEIFLPLPARGRRLLHLALPLVLLYHGKVVLVGRVVFCVLVAKAVARLPDLIEDEPRVRERLEAADVVLVRVSERRAGQMPDVPIILGVVLLGH